MSFQIGDRVRCIAGKDEGTIRFISRNSPEGVLYEIKFDDDIEVDLGDDEDTFTIPHVSFRMASQIKRIESAKVSRRYKSKVEEP